LAQEAQQAEGLAQEAQKLAAKAQEGELGEDQGGGGRGGAEVLGGARALGGGGGDPRGGGGGGGAEVGFGLSRRRSCPGHEGMPGDHPAKAPRGYPGDPTGRPGSGS
jgi:hypothetical protein